MMDSSGHVWSQAEDQTCGKMYWISHSLQQTSWELPKDCSGVWGELAPGVDQDPWKSLVDSSSGTIYYFNTETGVSSWESPWESLVRNVPCAEVDSRQTCDEVLSSEGNRFEGVEDAGYVTACKLRTTSSGSKRRHRQSLQESYECDLEIYEADGVIVHADADDVSQSDSSADQLDGVFFRHTSNEPELAAQVYLFHSTESGLAQGNETGASLQDQTWQRQLDLVHTKVLRLTNENAVQSNALRFEKDCAGELRANLSAESAAWYSHSQTQQHRIAALEKEMTAFETRDRRKDEIVMAHEREKLARHVQIEHHAQLVSRSKQLTCLSAAAAATAERKMAALQLRLELLLAQNVVHERKRDDSQSVARQLQESVWVYVRAFVCMRDVWVCCVPTYVFDRSRSYVLAAFMSHSYW